jgi:hypothetical protein
LNESDSSFKEEVRKKIKETKLAGKALKEIKVRARRRLRLRGEPRRVHRALYRVSPCETLVQGESSIAHSEFSLHLNSQ